MTIVKRGNELYALTDDIMVSAFLANGWEKYTPIPSKVEEKPTETKESVEPEKQEEVTDDLDSKSLKELRAIAKEKGINYFQKNAEKLREEIRNNG